MDTAATLELLLRVLSEANLLVHVDAVHVGTREQEGEVERVAVVRCANGRARLAEVLEEAADRGGLSGAEGSAPGLSD